MYSQSMLAGKAPLKKSTLTVIGDTAQRQSMVSPWRVYNVVQTLLTKITKLHYFDFQ